MNIRIKYDKLCENERQIFKVSMNRRKHALIASSHGDFGKNHESLIIEEASTCKQDSVMMLDAIDRYKVDLCSLCELICELKC